MPKSLPVIFCKFSRSPIVGSVLLILLLLAGCVSVPQNPNRQASILLRRAASITKNPAQRAALSLRAAERSLVLATDPTETPQHRSEAVALYNQAVRRSFVALSKKTENFTQDQGITLSSGEETFHLKFVTKGKSVKNPEGFTRLVDSGRVPRHQIQRDVVRDGIGGTLVGLQDGPPPNTPHRPPTGFAEPLTGVASFKPEANAKSINVTLTLYDPREEESVSLRKTKFPLAADFTAPLAYFPQRDSLIQGALAMLQSDRVAQKQGIYFLEAYDPNKIPVIFVHGLASAPQAWMNFVNNLNINPDFRLHYQVWVYLYPSGAPIAVNSLRFRNSIKEIAAEYHLKHKIVLVGHSMGGILSRLQVCDSGDTLWNSLFGSQAERMRKMFHDDSLIKQVLYFKRSPDISRVIFVATPHRGSDLAMMALATIPSRLIRMPQCIIQDFNSNLRYALRVINPNLTAIPTSISGLSPRSPFLRAINLLPVAVPCYSIIGNRGQDNLPLSKTSDGIVPYWSSHLDFAQSEIIVPTGHDAFKNERSEKEVLRILELNARAENME